MKKLLLITPFPPLPITSGGKNRVFHTIEQLSNYYKLTVWSFYNDWQELELNSNYFEKSKINYKFFPLTKKYFFSFLKLGQPYWFAQWFSKKLIKQLSQRQLEYDFIQIEATQLLYLIKMIKKNKNVLFTSYDVSTISFWRRLVNESSWVKKVWHFFRLMEVYFYEKNFLPLPRIVIAVSDKDQFYLKRFFKLKKTIILANGINKTNFIPDDIEKTISPKKQSIKIGFIGSFDHPPNKKAVEFIVQKILPILEKNQINYKFLLAGKIDSQEIACLINKLKIKSSQNIFPLGEVKEIVNFYSQIDVLVAPIFSGSGSRIKILESLSFAVPVLTTMVGAEGININTRLLEIIEEDSDKKPKVWVKKLLDLKCLKFNREILQKLDHQLQKITWRRILHSHLRLTQSLL